MASNISVGITADTARYKADMADAASASQRSFDQIRAAARAAAADTSVVDANTRGYSQSLMAMMASTDAEAEGVRKIATVAREAGAAQDGLQIATAGVSREFIVLAHEAMQGRFSRVPGSLMVLGERMGGLNLATMGAVAGVGALAFGFYELVKAANEAQSALEGVQAAAALHNLNIAAPQQEAFIEQVHRMAGASLTDAETVVRTFMNMKNATGPMIQAMIDQVELYALATGEKLPAAAKKLADAFSDPTKKGDEFLQAVSATRAEVEAFDSAIARGDRVGALTVMLTALAEATQRVENATHAATKSQKEAAEEIMALQGAMTGAVIGGEQLQRTIDGLDTDRIKKSAQDIAGALGAAGSGPAQGAPLAAVKEQLAEYAATHDASQAEILRNEVNTWQQRIAVGDLYGKELTQAETALARAKLQLHRQTGQEAINATRASLAAEAAEGTRGRAEMLQAAAASWKQLLDGDKLTAAQRVQVQRELNQTLAQLHGAERSNAIAGIDTQLQADQGYFDQKSAHIRELFDIHRVTASQETAQLRQIETERFAQLQRDYQEKLQFANDDVALQTKIYTELERLKREHQARMDKIDRDGVKSMQRSWQSTLQPIQTAFDGMLRGVLTGTQTWQQATQRILQNIIISYAEMFVKTEVQAIASELAKTAATVTGVAARTAAEEAGQATTRATQAATAKQGVLTHAYSAAAAVYDDVAQIPYVGWLLAPPAAATAFAAVAAFGGGIPSAAGGFDIPAGVNPLTQLHEREMVLPADIADRFRAGGGMAPNITFAVSAMDGASVQAFFNRNGRQLAETMKRYLAVNPSARPTF